VKTSKQGFLYGRVIDLFCMGSHLEWKKVYGKARGEAAGFMSVKTCSKFKFFSRKGGRLKKLITCTLE
jgi:hypothetical protein